MSRKQSKSKARKKAHVEEAWIQKEGRDFVFQPAWNCTREQAEEEFLKRGELYRGLRVVRVQIKELRGR